MKKTIIYSIAFFAGVLAPDITQAQGVVYLSNLGQTVTNSRAVGSDSWLAESFVTGNNAGGYMLNTVQLGMTNASGNPDSFAVMLYSVIRPSEFFPSNSLGTLNGSANPATSGVFTYTPASNLILSPSTTYFLVLTAGTTVANGSYEWGLASRNYNRNGGWDAPSGVAGSDIYQSSNGSDWTRTAMNPQFAITATAIPEPGVLSLFALGGMGFLWQRRKTKARSFSLVSKQR